MIFDWICIDGKWITVLYGIDDDHIFQNFPDWDFGL
jgi:hypothetical protein